MNFLLTGSSGYLGTEIYRNLSIKNKVLRIGRSKSNDIVKSLTCRIPNSVKIPYDIDFVIHSAGLAHNKHKNESIDYEKVNYIGTKNLCEWIESFNQKPKNFVFISSVAVYGLKTGNLIDENHPLDGKSAYSKSKIKAEKFLQIWAKKYNIKLLILRLPLIFSFNPPGNLFRMINSIKNGSYLSIGNGNAEKSIVFASDIAKFLSKINNQDGTYNLTDGKKYKIRDIEESICCKLNKPKPFGIPIWLARLFGILGDILIFLPVNSDKIDKLSNNLTFSDKKARKKLKWNPSGDLKNWKII
tara:strand:- start:2060 stop:2959 length:900 start_codon:yes stop_codon:yes gene_type:complete